MTSFINARRLELGPWQAFERMVARYLEHGGFKDVQIVGGTGDLGADIVGNFNGKSWVIQAKFRSGGSIGSSAISEAFNAHWHYKAKTMVAAGNKVFSPNALKQARAKKDAGFDFRIWGPSFFLETGDFNLNIMSAAYKKPRDYQRSAINAIHRSITNHEKRGLIALATGLGKTMVGATFVSEYLEGHPRCKILILAHMRELVKQLERAMWSQLPKTVDTHLWMDGESPSYLDGLTFATWQSISSAFKRGENLENIFDIIIVDECHHAPSEEFTKLLNDLNPNYLLGVTATPWRSDGRNLRNLFGDPLFSMNIVEGMQQGYLAGVDYQMLMDEIDWDEIREASYQGLTVRDLNQFLYIPERDQGMVCEIYEVISKTKDPRVLVFCRSIAHAERLQHFFKQFDLTAGVLHSDLHKSKSFSVLSRFRVGKIKILISIEMLNEGIDIPEVNIVVFARITHSRRIFLQQLGRGLRLSDEKSNVKVLDFVADVRRIAAGKELNTEAKSCKDIEEVRYPDGNIVKFNSNSEDFFNEYLKDMADISDLDEDATLKFPKC